MIQDIYLYMKLFQWSQREREQSYLLAELRKVHRASPRQRILGRLRTFFTAPGASKQQGNMPIPLEACVSEEEGLTLGDFSAEQIVTLYRLRRWYQMCNHQEHFVVLRHWEFLKLLVDSGRLEL